MALPFSFEVVKSQAGRAYHIYPHIGFDAVASHLYEDIYGMPCLLVTLKTVKEMDSHML